MMEDLSGNWTVLIEVTCCLMYIRTQKLRFSGSITFLLSAAFLAGMLGLQSVYVDVPGMSGLGEMLINIVLFKLIPMFAMCALLAEGGVCMAMFLFALGFTSSELISSILQRGVLTALSGLIRQTEASAAESAAGSLSAAGEILPGAAVWGSYAADLVSAAWFRTAVIAGTIALCLLALYAVQRLSGIFGTVHPGRRYALLASLVSYISFAVSYVWGWNITSEDSLTSQYLFITVYLSGLLILFLLQYSLRESEMREEMQTVQHTLDLRYQQYQDYVDNTSYLARQLHDMKHQIAGLRALEAWLRESAAAADFGNNMSPGATEGAGSVSAADPGKEAPGGTTAAADGSAGGAAGRASVELSSYIHDLDQAIARYETWNVSGNSVLDALLTQKKLFSAEHGIQLLVHADGTVLDEISARDICTIFGNLLDNAAEAVMQLPDPKERIIQVEVGRTGEFLLIRVENRCGEDVIVSTEGLPGTTKWNKKEHGIGLKSVRLTAESLGGSLNLSSEDGWFTAGILLPAGEQRVS